MVQAEFHESPAGVQNANRACFQGGYLREVVRSILGSSESTQILARL
jgi:hypothetical protein